MTSDLRPEARALFQAGRVVFSPTTADRTRVFEALVREIHSPARERPSTFGRTRRTLRRGLLPDC